MAAKLTFLLVYSQFSRLASLGFFTVSSDFFKKILFFGVSFFWSLDWATVIVLTRLCSDSENNWFERSFCDFGGVFISVFKKWLISFLALFWKEVSSFAVLFWQEGGDSKCSLEFLLVCSIKLWRVYLPTILSICVILFEILSWNNARRNDKRDSGSAQPPFEEIRIHISLIRLRSRIKLRLSVRSTVPTKPKCLRSSDTSK